MANLGFFGRNDKRKVIAAFSFLAVPPKTKKITKIFRQTKNDRFFVQAYLKWIKVLGRTNVGSDKCCFLALSQTNVVF